GYNLSSKPSEVSAYEPRRLAGDVAELIAERGASKACLAGHDWGAAVAWIAAMAHPPVVERLAILNVPHPRRMLEALSRPGRRLGRPRRRDPADPGAHPGHLGRARPLPGRRAGRAQARGCPEPRARRTPARCLPLGPARRARARVRAADRLLQGLSGPSPCGF